MDAEPVVRRRRVQQAPEPKRGGARPKRRSSGSAGPGSKAGKAPSPKQGAKAGKAPTTNIGRQMLLTTPRSASVPMVMPISAALTLPTADNAWSTLRQ